MRRLGRPVEASGDVAPGEATKQFSMHSFGAVFVEVAVDRDLAETRVGRIVGACGAGRIINPKLATSQCLGAMIGGIGMALMEDAVVDGATGASRTRTSPNMPCRSMLTARRAWR